MSHPTLALVCTGSAMPPESNVKKTQAYLAEKYQFTTVYKEDTYQGLSTEAKADIFLSYLFDEDITGIWSLRGGEGSADLLPYFEIQRDRIQKLTPKPLIGFSDFSAILLYFSQNFNWPVIHSHGALQLATGKADSHSERQLIDLLQEKNSATVLSDLIPLNNAAQQRNTLIAEVTGGNLSLIDISIKDCWELNADNRILLIEDWNERGYRIRRSLKYWQRIGLLENTIALIFGDFNCAPIGQTTQEQKHNAEAIQKDLQQFAESCLFPVLQTTSFGHGTQNYPLIFARQAKLKLGNNPELTMDYYEYMGRTMPTKS